MLLLNCLNRMCNNLTVVLIGIQCIFTILNEILLIHESSSIRTNRAGPEPTLCVIHCRHSVLRVLIDLSTQIRLAISRRILLA